MEKIELLLKNEKIKFYDRISLYIILINLALFILFAIRSEDKKIRITAVIGSILLLSLLLVNFFRVKTKNEKNNLFVYTSMIIATITWISIGKWWIGILCIILLLLHQISKRPLQVYFNMENIKYTSFPIKLISWRELNNAVLKDGILTIDFKNNKILQAEIDDTGIIINEKEFNDFCRQQLKP